MTKGGESTNGADILGATQGGSVKVHASRLGEDNFKKEDLSVSSSENKSIEGLVKKGIARVESKG